MSHPALYQIQLPAQPTAIAFVNGIIARDWAGCFWLWRHLNAIYRSTTQAPGCVQAKAGLCGPAEVLMVSYWRSEADLMAFFRSQAHRDLMQFASRQPQSLGLYNETYQPQKSGKYRHEPQGMATLYAAMPRSPEPAATAQS